MPSICVSLLGLVALSNTSPLDMINEKGPIMDSNIDQSILLVRIESAVAYVTLNRPHAGNSLSMELVARFHNELADISARPSIKVVVLAGTGARVFCAGHDLNEFAGQADQDFLARDFEGLAALMQQIMTQPQIVIAKVEGVATAAGCELVAACDLALASSEARFGAPGVNIGFWCHTPQIQLSRSVGRKEAMMMLATGRLFPAAHALRIGLVNAVYEPEALDAAVNALVAEIAAKPGPVLALGKAAFQKQAAMDVADAYRFAQGSALANLDLPDSQEGISAFLEKRAPRWSGEGS